MEGLSQDGLSYQAFPWQPCRVRLSRPSVGNHMQRGERIIRRDRKSRQNAEGHAYAEPPYLHSLRPRICVRFSGSVFDNLGSGLLGVEKACVLEDPLTNKIYDLAEAKIMIL